MLIVGLTGGIATGKSTVSRRFAELGAEVIDADLIAREIVEPGEPALAEIQRRFGPGVIDASGRLDRAALAEIIFRDENARKALEAIIHPRVRGRMRSRIERVKQEGRAPVVICDIPLLFETQAGLEWVDRTLVVYAPRQVQLQRLMARNGLTEAEAERRIEAQIPVAEKARRADYVIDNSGDLADTIKQVDQLWKEWTHAAPCADRPRCKKG